MNTYATGDKYQISIDTHQELDALLKLIINSQKDGFFNTKQHEFVDYSIDFSSDSTPPVFVDMFYNGLVQNSFNYYGVEDITSAEDFVSARAKVAGKKGTLCWEDIMLQVLSDGNIVLEDTYQEEKIKLNLIKVADNFLKAFNSDPNYFMKLVMQHVDESSDAVTYDCWLQMAVYGEVIYG
jgi:hypothetical protein